MTDITALISVEKIATQHRLSRLIAYASDDELRQMAVEVEQYTDRLLEAVSHYKSREERVTKLVLDNSVSWEELFKQLQAEKQRNAELVEALEAKDKQITEHNFENRLLANADRDIKALRQRIAELESRTVKLPPRVDSSNVPFTAHTWNCCLDAVEKCLAAAGIQVIEGEG
ncbi:hypothetical protein WP3W18E02_19440 [Klebsiella sp. WP3-W18-ESBL-02]|uniref:hypothetical protein n=1 Tax=Klebsiella sp. WP3-W18-ESBL-02 TaxID=2675710 RepID=UPI0015DC50E7|nr:hypothetical protein [Klebsiella sp. WP3-W18-ESBL-02]BBQ83415.1 hypothetical protein WP3W18E02_19440 [Klebsiella sp. WP3-W18-ESBL-02]